MGKAAWRDGIEKQRLCLLKCCATDTGVAKRLASLSARRSNLHVASSKDRRVGLASVLRKWTCRSAAPELSSSRDVYAAVDGFRLDGWPAASQLERQRPPDFTGHCNREVDVYPAIHC